MVTVLEQPDEDRRERAEPYHGAGDEGGHLDSPSIEAIRRSKMPTTSTAVPPLTPGTTSKLPISSPRAELTAADRFFAGIGAPETK